MSRVIDKLNQIVKVAPQPLGFRTAQPALLKPQMMLVASLAQAEDSDRMADRVTGADAVLLPMTKSKLSAKALKEIIKTLPDIPWGWWLEDTDEKQLAVIAEAGCDFVVFPADSAMALTVANDEMGKVLRVEPSLSDGLLRAVNELPVDAVLIAAEHGRDPLSWYDLMQLQRFASFLTKALLVSVPSNIKADELKPLWKAGVDGIVIEVSMEQPTSSLKELRQAISDPAFLPPRKMGKAEALLPRIGQQAAAEIEEEEEEEEE